MDVALDDIISQGRGGGENGNKAPAEGTGAAAPHNGKGDNGGKGGGKTTGDQEGKNDRARGGPPREGRRGDDFTVQKHLKVFVGGLPPGALESHVGHHFARYGHILKVTMVPAKDGDAKRTTYAFVTYKFAADADCAVVDPQPFPGSSKALTMGFATPKRKDEAEEERRKSLLSPSDPCKVFVGGISDRDNEEEIGDFFSQWGLVTLVYRDRTWGLVHFATKEAALRLLEEEQIVFQTRSLVVKASDSSKKPMDDRDRSELARRAIARHFHKKQMLAHGMPPTAYAPHPGFPGGPPPSYYGSPPAHGAAPAGYYGPPPAGPGAPPPGYYGAPPPGPGGPSPYYGHPPAGASPPALMDQAPPPGPAPDYYRPGGAGAPPAPDPYAEYYARGDPYAAQRGPPPAAAGAPPAGGYYGAGQPGSTPPPGGYHPDAHPPRQEAPPSGRDGYHQESSGSTSDSLSPSNDPYGAQRHARGGGRPRPY